MEFARSVCKGFCDRISRRKEFQEFVAICCQYLLISISAHSHARTYEIGAAQNGRKAKGAARLPARSKCKWSSRKNNLGRAFMLGPSSRRTFCASLRNRHAPGHVTTTILLTHYIFPRKSCGLELRPRVCGRLRSRRAYGYVPKAKKMPGPAIGQNWRCRPRASLQNRNGHVR